MKSIDWAGGCRKHDDCHQGSKDGGGQIGDLFGRKSQQDLLKGWVWLWEGCDDIY